MVIINNDMTCSRCDKKTKQCNAINWANLEKDTFVCNDWHLNFKEYLDED